MKQQVKKFVWLLLVAGAVLTGFTGCRTAHGFGEDVESAGEHIQEGTR